MKNYKTTKKEESLKTKVKRFFNNMFKNLFANDIKQVEFETEVNPFFGDTESIIFTKKLIKKVEQNDKRKSENNDALLVYNPKKKKFESVSPEKKEAAVRKARVKVHSKIKEQTKSFEKDKTVTLKKKKNNKKRRK